MTTPTLHQVALKMRELAHERPDHVYQAVNDACMYVHRDEHHKPVPGCLVGHALLALDVDPDLIPERVEAGTALMELGIIKDSSPLSRAVDRVQGNQDYGQPWGEAIEPIEEYYNTHDEPSEAELRG